MTPDWTGEGVGATDVETPTSQPSGDRPAGPDPLRRGGFVADRTTVLEASAGTGKTYTIAALAARYIAEGHVGFTS